MTRTRVLLATVGTTAALALGGGAVWADVVPSGAGAAATPAPVPAAVTRWFAEQAPTVSADVLQRDAVDVAGRTGASGYTVGRPTPLHHWSGDFLAGRSDVVAGAPDEWVATLYADGRVVGTIAATMSGTGTVRFSYLDDDVSAGTGLVTPPAGTVVQDPQVGGLVEVRPGGGVEALSAAARKPMNGIEDVAHLRSAVSTVHKAGTNPALDAGGTAGADREQPAGGPTALPTIAGAALFTAGAALLVVRRRRTGRTPGDVAPVAEVPAGP